MDSLQALRRCVGGGILLSMAWARPGVVEAQLISPGALAAPHAELEGMLNCTQCHTLGARGVDPERCLSCHTLVANRVELGVGVHGSPDAEECGACHKDHYGRAFELLRFDPESFEHADAGYPLEGSHAEISCRDCHRPELISAKDVLAAELADERMARTFLGLQGECAACHSTQDPHSGQFPDRACTDCHDQQAWSPAPSLDHRETRFPLEGLHGEVACEACHLPRRRTQRGSAGGGTPSGSTTGPTPTAGPVLGAARFRGIEASDCRSCHEDPHRGVMDGSCATCHVVAGWGRVPEGVETRGFDHARTNFALSGAHRALSCDACHGGQMATSATIAIRFRPGSASSTYPRPAVQGCWSCHRDAHDGVLRTDEGRTPCDACHSDTGWTPSSFGLARHDAESSFPLTGAHRATPCVACHAPRDAEGPLRFRVADRDCTGCHGSDDPHEGLFGAESCGECHGTDRFLPAKFDHDAWLERLPGSSSCSKCHGDDDPHGLQFQDRDCQECHRVEAFTPSTFDHATSRFPLDGAHRSASCTACHTRGQVGGGGVGTVFRPLGTRCRDCHGGAP